MSFTPTILSKPLPKFYKGWNNRTPWVIVVHYSAGFDAPGCHQTLENRGLSVHATIERDGVIWREVADENRAIHAGYGRWGGVSGMNSHALGFEIANVGWMEGAFTGNSPHFVYRPPAGTEINTLGDNVTSYYRDDSYTKNGQPKTTRILTETKCESFTDHREGWKDKLWSVYPDEQLEASFWLMWQWVKKYDILPENVIGHEHVTPHKKQDPGPHFPWKKWEAYLEEKCRAEKPELLDPTLRQRERVKAVQSHCARMGLSVGDVDGYWGDMTTAAVKTAVKKYGDVYGFSGVNVHPANCLQLANALRLVPGFDPERA